MWSRNVYVQVDIGLKLTSLTMVMRSINYVEDNKLEFESIKGISRIYIYKCLYLWLSFFIFWISGVTVVDVYFSTHFLDLKSTATTLLFG